MLWGVILIAFGVYALRFLLSTDPPPILGVYSQPGKWYTLKYWLFFLLFKLRQRQNQQKKSVAGQTAGYGLRSRDSMEEMDRTQPLSPAHPKAVDAVYFNAADRQGYYLVAATARRHDNLVQTLLYLRVPDLGLFHLPSLPDANILGSEDNAFAAGGLRISPVEPMKTWKLEYTGPMTFIPAGSDVTEEVNVKFSLDWTATTKLFDFDTDMEVWAMCDSMAREPWTREFFDNLQKLHQTHYEQFGEVTGTVELGGYGRRELRVRGVRDHSYGNVRDWSHLHRYAIQYAQLADGTALCLGVICMPHTLSRITMGYVFQPDGRMDKVQRTDLQLHQLGEDGNDPDHFRFNFWAAGRKYELEGHVLDCPIFYMGVDWDARIHERMCTYKVNGVEGWGISEWDYRNKTGKNVVFKRQKNQS